MPQWITCDEVFDALTRGPFPSGATSEVAAVELHIAGCHECRQLAEALRPAVNMLQESLQDDELPAYRGAAGANFPSNWEPVFPAMGSAANLSTERRRAEPWNRCVETDAADAIRTVPQHAVTKLDPKSVFIAHAARVLAACLVILLMVGAIPLFVAMQGPPDSTEIHSRLMSAPLPAPCRVSLLSAAGEGCCARCHHAAPDKAHRTDAAVPTLIARNSIRLVTTSCLACHE